MTLIIEALARQLGEDEPIDGFSAEKLREYYLINRLEKGERRYKLHLSQTDKETLWTIVDQKPLPSEYSLLLKENLDYFEEQVRGLGSELEPLCRGLAKLIVVEVVLDRGQDNPQLIFESMNSTGLELSVADLVRNFILLGLEPGDQNRLYNDHWRPMEVAFGQAAYADQFDDFLRYYLTVKFYELPKKDEVYKKFKEHVAREDVVATGIDALVADLHRFADHYCTMELKREKNRASCLVRGPTGTQGECHISASTGTLR